MLNPAVYSLERFLIAYAFLVVLFLAVVYLQWVLAGRAGRAVKVNDLTADPYRIAWLRSGPRETLHVALFNLVDRGILNFDGSHVSTLRPEALEALRRPLDRVLVKVCLNPRTVRELRANPTVRDAIESYGNELSARGLVSAGSEWAWRRTVGWGAFVILIGLLVARVMNEIASGPLSIRPAALAALAAPIFVMVIAHLRRTFIGGRMLASLRSLLARLKARAPLAKPGGESNEALLIAATFSLFLLPSSAFPYVSEMFPRPTVDTGDVSASWDEGGCGADGDGGGCGGCGGCGG